MKSGQTPNKNWFKSHPILAVILGIFAFGLIVSAFDNADVDSQKASLYNYEAVPAASIAPAYNQSLPSAQTIQTPRPTYKAPQPQEPVRYYENTAGNKIGRAHV